MENKMRRFVMFVMTYIIMLSGLFSPVFAATSTSRVPITCYPIAQSNFRSYSSVNGTAAGWIYPSDRCTIKAVYSSGWVLVNYPTSNGSRTLYTQSSNFFVNTNFSTATVKSGTARTVYTKSNLSTKLGSTYASDNVIITGSRNGNQQILYPVSGGYKLGFISGSISSGTSASRWADPMTKAYVCGNNWRSYYSARPSRPYHAGLDLASSKGDANVYAAADGVVAATGYNSANGYFVVIRHTLNGSTVYSFYCHLSSISTSANKNVSLGTKIGVYGNSGSASAGAHLHFAIVNKIGRAHV